MNPLDQTVADNDSQEKLARKPGSRFASDVVRVASGTIFAQALAVLASPILTRLFAPEAFGISALFASIVAVLSIQSGLRYPDAIMLPEKDEDAANLLGLSLLFVIFTSLLIAIMVYLAADQLLDLLNASELRPYIWMLPVMAFVSGVLDPLAQWNNRARRFGRTALISVNSSLSSTGVQVGAGFAGFTSGGNLIAGRVTGVTVSLLVLLLQSWREDGKLFLKSLGWDGMLKAASRYRDFPIYTTWSALLNQLSWELPSFMLQLYFSSSVVGFYALAHRVMRLPINLLGTSVSQVFYQRAAEAQQEGKLASVVESVISRSFAIGLFPMLIFTLLAPDLFIVAFGSNWAEAGVYMQILSLYSFLWLIVAPLTSLFRVLEKQRFGLVWNFANFGTRFLSLVAGGILGNSRLALFLFALSGMFVYGYLFVRIAGFSGVPFSKLFRVFVEKFLVYSPFALVVLFLKLLGLHSWVLLGAGSVMVAAYYAFLIKRDPQIQSIIPLSMGWKDRASKP